MAFIGLRYPVAATFAQTADGATPTYSGGTVIGRAIQANLTKTANNNPLYADDIIDEDDNSLTAMSIQLGMNDLTDAERVLLLGDIAVMSSGETPTATGEYDEADGGSSPVGFGYIRVRRKGGLTKYQAVWYWKALFTEDSEESQTKGESIEWKTPTITGRVHGCYIDASGKAKFRRRQTFDTEAAAKSWLNTKAGISSSSGST